MWAFAIPSTHTREARGLMGDQGIAERSCRNLAPCCRILMVMIPTMVPPNTLTAIRSVHVLMLRDYRKRAQKSGTKERRERGKERGKERRKGRSDTLASGYKTKPMNHMSLSSFLRASFARVCVCGEGERKRRKSDIVIEGDDTHPPVQDPRRSYPELAISLQLRSPREASRANPRRSAPALPLLRGFP